MALQGTIGIIVTTPWVMQITIGIIVTTPWVKQGIIEYSGMEPRQLFFSYVCKSKDFLKSCPLIF